MFVAAMLPILGLLPFEFQTYSTVADHYLYPATLAAALAVAFGLSKLPSRRWIIPAGAMIATFALLSHRQAQTWQSTRGLLEHTLGLNPTSLAANDGLGRYWLAHDDMEQAIGFLANACRLHPNVARVHFDYGNALAKQGLLPLALDEYSQAVRIDRSEAKYFVNAGNVLFQMGDLEQALRSFDQAAALDPDSAAPLENSGVVLERMGRFALARQRFASALRIDPTSRIAQDGLKRVEGK
jgi:tetratricopeptide (TPR) repeat protein